MALDVGLWTELRKLLERPSRQGRRLLHPFSHLLVPVLVAVAKRLDHRPQSSNSIEAIDIEGGYRPLRRVPGCGQRQGGATVALNGASNCDQLPRPRGVRGYEAGGQHPRRPRHTVIGDPQPVRRRSVHGRDAEAVRSDHPIVRPGRDGRSRPTDAQRRATSRLHSSDRREARRSVDRAGRTGSGQACARRCTGGGRLGGRVGCGGDRRRCRVLAPGCAARSQYQRQPPADASHNRLRPQSSHASNTCRERRCPWQGRLSHSCRRSAVPRQRRSADRSYRVGRAVGSAGTYSVSSSMAPGHATHSRPHRRQKAACAADSSAVEGSSCASAVATSSHSSESGSSAFHRIWVPQMQSDRATAEVWLAVDLPIAGAAGCHTVGACPPMPDRVTDGERRPGVACRAWWCAPESRQRASVTAGAMSSTRSLTLWIAATTAKSASAGRVGSRRSADLPIGTL